MSAPAPIYSVAPWLQRHWDIRAAGNFIGGGAGTGLLIAAAGGGFAGAPVTPFVLAGLIFIALGLFSVFLELGRPFRSINVLFNAKTSWMTREAFVAAPLFPVGLLAAWLDNAWLASLAALIAVGFLYCQGRILIAAKGIPAWRNPLVLPLILATGLAEGTGVYLIGGGLLLPQATAPAAPMAAALLLVAVAMRIVAWRNYRRALEPDNAPDAALRIFAKAETLLTIVGHMAPVLLIFGALALPALSGPLAALGGAAAAFGGWHLKFTLITRAAYNQGFAIVHTPERGKGGGGPGAKPGWGGQPYA